MNCPRCSQPIETGAAFCGNCGQSLQAAPPTSRSPISQVINNQAASAGPPPNFGISAAQAGHIAVPAYALATKSQHRGEMTSLWSIICGVFGLGGALLIPVVALAFGITGVVLGTLTRHTPYRRMSTIGLILSSLAILGGLAGWAYNISQDPAMKEKTSHTPPTSSSIVADVSTPCYSMGFATKLTVKNDPDSCDLQAFDGTSYNDSEHIYKIYANNIKGLDESNLDASAKVALEKDIEKNLPGFEITSQGSTSFAGSPAYFARASNSTTGVGVIEAAVFHQTSNGYNSFLLLHGSYEKDINLDELEAQWQWQ